MRHLFAVASVILAAFLLMPSNSLGKGSHEVAISGGDLETSVVIPVAEMDKVSRFFSLTSQQPVLPDELAYKVEFFVVDGQTRIHTGSFAYYPAGSEGTALLMEKTRRIPGLREGACAAVPWMRPCWLRPDPAFQTLLDSSIQSGPRSLPAAGGPPSGDSQRSPWHFAAALLGSVVMLGVAAMRHRARSVGV